jgi:hypothetical protein
VASAMEMAILLLVMLASALLLQSKILGFIAKYSSFSSFSKQLIPFRLDVLFSVTFRMGALAEV